MNKQICEKCKQELSDAVDDNSNKLLKRSFQNLWVAGTLGAFFAALASNIPKHVSQINFSSNFDCDYTIDLFIRYVYVVWLLVYFFISNLNNNRSSSITNQDIIFDIIQSIAALTAVYYLGFVSSGLEVGSFASYAWASGSIFIICLSSLILFWPIDKANDIRKIRFSGLIFSLASCVFALIFHFKEDNMQLMNVFWIFVLLQIALGVVLFKFIHKRLTSKSDSNFA
jgi:hypothetical protein